MGPPPKLPSALTLSSLTDMDPLCPTPFTLPTTVPLLCTTVHLWSTTPPLFSTTPPLLSTTLPLLSTTLPSLLTPPPTTPPLPTSRRVNLLLMLTNTELPMTTARLSSTPLRPLILPETLPVATPLPFPTAA